MTKKQIERLANDTWDLPEMDFQDLLAAMELIRSGVWKDAARKVSECMSHYENKMGDPNGCLMGLACEFRANADGL